MRLICPNCDAEYEIEAGLIPEGGRDVQCSACGHGWYQLPEGAAAEAEEEAALYDAPADEAPADEAPGPQDAAPAEPAVMAPGPGRGLDDNLLAVLREEAERETAARRAEDAVFERQEEMPLAGSAVEILPVPEPEAQAPLDGALPGAPAGPEAPLVAPPEAAVERPLGPAAAALRRIARLRGIDPDAKGAAPSAKARRSALLPEIEEINSTLRAANEARAVDQGAVAKTLSTAGGSAFRRGFLSAMTVVILGAALYLAAPILAARVPQLAPAATAYVETVDGLRLTLDGLARGLSARLMAIVGGQG